VRCDDLMLRTPLKKISSDLGPHLFSPTAYRLDRDCVLNLSLKQACATADGKEELVPTTIGAVLMRFADLCVRDDDDAIDIQDLLSAGGRAITESSDTFVVAGEFAHGTEFKTSNGHDLVVGGPSFNREVLKTVFDLGKERIDPFDTIWFWYESYSDGDNEDWHSFFVVRDDNIVRERVVFGDDRRSYVHAGQSGFTPSIFIADGDGDDDPEADVSWLWRRENWRVAEDRFWYRKFYQETKTGQMMVLRPDRPKLHHFPDSRWLLAALELYLRWCRGRA